MAHKIVYNKITSTKVNSKLRNLSLLSLPQWLNWYISLQLFQLNIHRCFSRSRQTHLYFLKKQNQITCQANIFNIMVKYRFGGGPTSHQHDLINLSSNCKKCRGYNSPKIIQFKLIFYIQLFTHIPKQTLIITKLWLFPAK